MNLDFLHIFFDLLITYTQTLFGSQNTYIEMFTSFEVFIIHYFKWIFFKLDSAQQSQFKNTSSSEYRFPQI